MWTKAFSMNVRGFCITAVTAFLFFSADTYGQETPAEVEAHSGDRQLDAMISDEDPQSGMPSVYVGELFSLVAQLDTAAILSLSRRQRINWPLEAVNWLRAAAILEDSVAMFELAILYQTPTIRFHSVEKAAAWLILALESGGINRQVVSDEINSETIERMQQILQAFGLYEGEIDGVIGPFTIEAIQQCPCDEILRTVIADEDVEELFARPLVDNIPSEVMETFSQLQQDYQIPDEATISILSAVQYSFSTSRWSGPYNLALQLSNDTTLTYAMPAANFLHTIAAEFGDFGPSMNMLGVAYQFGHGVEPSQSQATYWLNMAVRAGNVDAMNNLGRNLLQEPVSLEDQKEARRLFRLAASHGSNDGMVNYGYMLSIGRGGNVNEEAAAIYLLRSAMFGGEWLRSNFSTLPIPTRIAIQETLAEVGIYDGPVDGVAYSEFMTILHELAFENLVGFDGANLLQRALGHEFSNRGDSMEHTLAAFWLLRSAAIGNDWLVSNGIFVSNNTMAEIQRFLIDLELYRGAVDGLWGPGTREAILNLAP